MKKEAIIAPDNEKEIRRILEKKEGIILVDLEKTKKKDALKSLASGLTPVLARIAARNKNAIGIDLKSLRTKEKREKARLLARIKQNIALTRKAKTLLVLKKESEEESFVLLSLGASSKQTKEARTQSF